jgi:hypothetical protein
METYEEFLARVHRQDVENQRAMHKPGVCPVCDEARGKSDCQEGESE